jgi:hypothetical protein
MSQPQLGFDGVSADATGSILAGRERTPFGVLPPAAVIPDDARSRELFHPSTFPLTMIFICACFRGRRDRRPETNDEVRPISAAFRRLRGRVTGSATAKPDSFAITVDGINTIGVIVPLIWNAACRYDLPTA